MKLHLVSNAIEACRHQFHKQRVGLGATRRQEQGAAAMMIKSAAELEAVTQATMMMTKEKERKNEKEREKTSTGGRERPRHQLNGMKVI